MNSFLLKKIVTKNARQVRWSSSQPVAASKNEITTKLIDDNIVPFLEPAFNFAAFTNKSETLQQLVNLGVDLTKIEKRKGLPQFLLRLDFERDIKHHITFLNDLGIPANTYGRFITKNPLFFKESIEDLETRVFYLQSKKFNMDEIQTIVCKNPFWLNFNTKRIDRRLGYFQKNFDLTGNDVRFLTSKQPNLITYNMQHVRETTFAVLEEMGFGKDETKCLLLNIPKIWMMKRDDILDRFNFIHKRMKVSHAQIIQLPDILLSRESRTRQRHEFLKFLRKDQYDSNHELYISLKQLVEGSDKDFVVNTCESNLETFDNFIKTL